MLSKELQANTAYVCRTKRIAPTYEYEVWHLLGGVDLAFALSAGPATLVLLRRNGQGLYFDLDNVLLAVDDVE